MLLLRGGAVGKHSGGRAAEADLERLLTEDPDCGLVSQHYTPGRPWWRPCLSITFRGMRGGLSIGHHHWSDDMYPPWSTCALQGGLGGDTSSASPSEECVESSE